MWTTHVSFPVSDRAREVYGNRNFNGYGLGWSTSEYFGRQFISHTGGYDGMYSAVLLFPTEKIGIVVLTNTQRSIGTLLGYEIVDKLLGLPQHDWKERGINRIHFETGNSAEFPLFVSLFPLLNIDSDTRPRHLRMCQVLPDDRADHVWSSFQRHMDRTIRNKVNTFEQDHPIVIFLLPPIVQLPPR